MKSIVGGVVKAYTTSPMPFRPGYGIGSIVSPEFITDLKEEAKIRSEIVLSDQIIRDVQNTQRELELMNDSTITGPEGLPDDVQAVIAENHTKLNATLKEGLTQKCTNLSALFELQTKQLDKIKDGKDTFSTFNSKIESPVDFGASKIVYLDRSFDSINIDSTFVNHNTVRQEGKDSSSACASSVSAGLTYWSSHIASEVQQQVAAKTTTTSDTHNLETTLIITSWATHRKVKQLIPMIFNCDHLLNAWNDSFPDDKLDLDKIMAGQAPENLESDTNELSIISEVYLGSCLVGLVHFLKNEDTTSSQSQVNTASQAMASLSENCLFASITGETSIATEYGRKLAKMSSETGIGIKFDLLCYGYIPTIKPNMVESSVKAFKDFDPAHFDQAAIQDQANLSGIKGSLMSDNKKRTEQQSNAGSVIQSTIMGLQKAEEYSATYQVMDVNTFMTAFDDYANHCRDTEGIGIPVGLNIHSFSKRDVIDELGKKYDQRRQTGGDKEQTGGDETGGET